jgi:diguanylate cyclase (GGDEF)-like protein
MDRPTELLALSAAALARGRDLDQTLATLLKETARAVDAEVGAVFLQDPDRPELQLVATVGMPPEADPAFEAEARLDDHPIATAARERVAAFDRAGVMPDGTAFVGADLPLIIESGGLETGVGVMSFGWSTPHELDDVDRATLRAMADLAAVAIDRAQLASLVAERADWFERMAHMDPLTGLANERTFDRVLELELARAGRQGGEVSLAVFDVDGLTATNEAAGHAAGDDVLRAVAAVLAESVRLVDTVARIGGDEFVLIAPGSAGLTVARRVLAGIAALPATAGGPVSVSAGVARFPLDAADPRDLIAAAKAALEEARSAGAGGIGAAPLSTAGQ